jgi:hypothetical protein
MHEVIAFIAGVLRLYMFRAYASIFRGNSLCKAATMVFLNFSSGGSCVGSGGVETCCSRGSHYSSSVWVAVVWERVVAEGVTTSRVVCG